MAAQTEAACLIEAGALYKRRVGLRTPDGRTTFAGFKPGGFALFDDDAPFYHFDREGRWQRALIEGIHYLKGLDGRVVAIDRVREGANMRLHRRSVPFGEANDLDATVRSAAIDLIGEVRSGAREAVEPTKPGQALDRDGLLDMLERIARWDAAAWFRHRERYLETYGPLPFLPPDAQQSAVFQATLGHPVEVAYGGGPGAEHYVRDRPEFEAHVAQVLELLGLRRDQCTTAFLAGADFLRQDRAWILECLDAVADRCRERAADAPAWKGSITFADDFPSGWIEPEFGRQLAEHGLKRLVLGIESGDPAIRSACGKSWEDRDLIEGLQGRPEGWGLSVLTLARPGETASIDATAALLRQLPWKPGDSVFVLDAAELGGGSTPLDEPDFEAQVAALKAGLAGAGPKVLPYSTDRQWA
ncbi:MAG: hypothetical protein U0800_05470 [Isosphaeraceae bacterium]